MALAEKVAYIKGLSEGLGLDEKSKEGRIIKLILEVMEDMAESIEELDRDCTEMSDQINSIDKDLESLEDDFYDDDCDCCCGDEDDDDDDEEFYQVVCPSCNEVVYLDSDMLKVGHMDCPACGEKLEFEDLMEQSDD